MSDESPSTDKIRILQDPTTQFHDFQLGENAAQDLYERYVRDIREGRETTFMRIVELVMGLPKRHTVSFRYHVLFCYHRRKEEFFRDSPDPLIEALIKIAQCWSDA